jgi:hypothetical protein
LKTEDLISSGGTTKELSGIKNDDESGTSIGVYVTSAFDRVTRNCHVCRTITEESCTRKGGSWFTTHDTNCETNVTGPTCEDIKM